MQAFSNSFQKNENMQNGERNKTKYFSNRMISLKTNRVRVAKKVQIMQHNCEYQGMYI